MKQLPFGLDIGVSTIKAVWLSQSDNGFMLNATNMVPTPAKGMLSQSPLDQEEMARAIRGMVLEAQIKTKYVNIALPENQVYTRVIEMPFLSDKELSSAIYWEAEQYIPLPPSSAIFDYKILSRSENPEEPSKMRVLLVGAPTSLVSSYQKVVAMAGFSVAAAETEVLATTRSLIYPLSSDQNQNLPATIIIGIGTLITSLIIVKNGVLVFTYTIPLGGNAISRAIASDFGFTMEQAEQYKKAYGVSKKNLEGKIGKASEPILTSILSEVRKAIAFYKERYKEDSVIQQVILSGGSARLPGLDVFFAENLGIETVVANPWKALESQQVPKEILDNSSEYSIAVGLAMRGYD
ncbi:type IV pilus assembly protein PilM [Patescibacteria group bacterium]|nr:type IV pilus assembly protein PilM [Patescibacteria group bacterium]MCL5010331.1 type IV pilus assembly protein PilM [Patescibacteria group bacterium]